MENITDKVWELLTLYGFKVIAAFIVLVVGRWVAKFLRNIARRLMEKREVDPTIVSFTIGLTYIALMAFIILASLGQLGIQTTSFIAIIGAAGLAIGLALQGSLANFAAGFLMIIFKPFKVGDYIEGAGTAGTVEEIQVFTTQLKTPDNKTIIIPNAKLTADNIVNISAKPTRRVDFTFGVGYTDDIDEVRQVIVDVLGEDKRILRDPPPTIGVLELADSSVNFAVRPWVNTADYWSVFFDINEAMKKRFDKEGVNIPFPQRDVHLYEMKS
jgi:small conductance mechanosensitive channel